MWWLPSLLFLLPVILSAEKEKDGHPFYRLYSKTNGDVLVLKRPGISSSAPLPWPNATVLFRFHEDYSENQKKPITKAIEEIERRTCVEFEEVGADNGNHVLIMKQSTYGKEPDCRSAIGMIPKDETMPGQPLYLDGCSDNKKILHELLHTLGFEHEHNRADRDDYVTIMFENILPEYRSNFLKRSIADELLLDSPYALDSIMHYTSNEYSYNDLEETIISYEREKRMGGRGGLSRIDIHRINRLYGCNQTEEETGEEEEEEKANEGEEDWESDSFKYENCSDALKTPQARGNCRHYLMGNATDPDSSAYYLHCERTKNPNDEGCGIWERRECPQGTQFNKSDKTCRPSKRRSAFG